MISHVFSHVFRDGQVASFSSSSPKRPPRLKAWRRALAARSKPWPLGRTQEMLVAETRTATLRARRTIWFAFDIATLRSIKLGQIGRQVVPEKGGVSFGVLFLTVWDKQPSGGSSHLDVLQFLRDWGVQDETKVHILEPPTSKMLCQCQALSYCQRGRQQSCHE